MGTQPTRPCRVGDQVAHTSQQPTRSITATPPPGRPRATASRGCGAKSPPPAAQYQPAVPPRAPAAEVPEQAGRTSTARERARPMTRLGTMIRRGTTPAATARAAEEHPEPAAPGWSAIGLRVSGAALLIATAAIHLDLYVTGYRTIPTIGWLFLLQVIAAFGLGGRRTRHRRQARQGRTAGCGCRSRLRLRYPRRLPAVGLDRAVRVQGSPHDRRRGRGLDRGGRLRRARRAHPHPRRCPGSRPATPGSPPGSRPRSPQRPQ